MSPNARTAGGELAGQVAMVTGGGRGLGRVYAQWLAQAGAAVAVVARSADQLAGTVSLIEEAGGYAIALRADVTDQQAVEEAVAQVAQQLGPVDLLVNNAGIAGPGGPGWEVDAHDWWHCIDVNLRGSFLCARAALPSMIARCTGRIINVASGAGLGPIPYVSGYVISKTAVIRFTENLAAEVKEHGVSVFAIDPGTVRTPMMEAILADPAKRKWVPWLPQIFEEGHDEAPERAAELVLFLASGRADALSGCFIRVGDDVVDMVRRAEEIQQNDLHTLRLRT